MIVQEEEGSDGTSRCSKHRRHSNSALALDYCWMFVTSGVDYQQTTSPVTTAPPTTQAVVASIRCQPPELRMGIGPPVSPETGEHPLLLTLTNEGPGACYLDGYPGITLYDANNALLPLSYQRHGYQTTGPAPQRVDIAPGSAAFVMVSKYRCDSGDKDTAVSLRLIPPDDTTSMTVSIQGQQDLSYCGPGDPGSELEISPVEPTAAATTAS
jgi:hypothetical protein